MPSLHFGWALIIAVAFIAVRRTRWSVVALAHPAVTLLAIVATANHYWIDAAVALLLVSGTVMVVRAIHLKGAVPRRRGHLSVDTQVGAYPCHRVSERLDDRAGCGCHDCGRDPR